MAGKLTDKLVTAIQTVADNTGLPQGIHIAEDGFADNTAFGCSPNEIFVVLPSAYFSPEWRGEI